MGQFDEQVALVTGASGAVGGALALALNSAGARVCMVGRNEAALEATCAEAKGEYPPATQLLDLTDDAAVLRLANHVREAYGRLDILVHAAGVFSRGAIESASVSELDAQYRVNLRAPYLLTQSLLPLLRESRGQVAFINSTAVLGGHAGVSQYSATKAGLRALAEAFRIEVKPLGIRVLNLFLGRTASAMQQRVHELESRPYHPGTLVQPAEVATLALCLFSLPRSAEVGDVVLRPVTRC